MDISSLPKCLLLPLDGSDDALLPIRFVRRLYPRLDRINLILCYFQPSLSPIYQEHSTTRQMAVKKKEAVKEREEESQAVLQRAKSYLMDAGFSSELIQEFEQEKAMSTADHICQLAEIKKVDAVLVQKRVSSRLEGFLRGDPRDALLHHCIVSPVWFTDGEIDPSRAVICLQDEDASLRAVDHAAFMLADGKTMINLLHVSDAVGHPITSAVDEYSEDLRQWFKTETGRTMSRFIDEAGRILKDAEIAAERIRIDILPGSTKEGKVALSVLAYAKNDGIGIVVLGHSAPEGMWSFLKTSVTSRILDEFQDMAIWVNQ